MEMPVIITPLPDQGGYSAQLPALNLTAKGATANEAEARLVEMFADQLRTGVEIRRFSVPRMVASAGWLPDDELTQEWLKYVEEYRAECDRRDREQLEEFDRLEGLRDHETAP